MNISKETKKHSFNHTQFISALQNHTGIDFQRWINDSAKSPVGTSSLGEEQELLKEPQEHLRFETSGIERCGHGGEKCMFPVRGTVLTCPASQTPYSTTSWPQITQPASPSLATCDELPEDSQGTAGFNPYFPKNSWRKTLTQQSKATSHHLTRNII